MSKNNVQLLIDVDGKSTEFVNDVKISEISVSPHNPRTTHSDDHISELAKSITERGYDNAFAVKCYLDGKHIMCFAGSNRILACQKIGKTSMPIFIYHGYSDDEIWRMAYADNELAGIQAQLTCVDIWMDYASKYQDGYTQQQIADALGVSQKIVSWRLQMSNLPSTVLDAFSTITFLTERIARELLLLVPGTKTTWHDPEAFIIEIIEGIAKKRSATTITAKHFAIEVARYNTAAKKVDEAIDVLLNDDDDDKAKFLDLFIHNITEERIRTEAGISKAMIKWLKRQTVYFDEKSKAAKDTADATDAATIEEAKIQDLLNGIVYGDATKEASQTPTDTRLIFIDPPYGVDFQSNRRTATAKSKKIDGDQTLSEAVALLSSVLKQADAVIENDYTVLVWCNWRCEAAFIEVIKSIRLSVKGSLIWVKSNHGTGDLQYSFAPKHERIIHATRGNIQLSKRMPDVFNGTEFIDTDHPTKKPIDLMGKLIEATTDDDDVVCDHFMGIGSTAIAALKAKRRFFGVELNKGYYDSAISTVYKYLKDNINGTD